MRRLLELVLERLLEEIKKEKKDYYLGLCVIVNILRRFDQVTSAEWYELHDYINEHTPERYPLNHPWSRYSWNPQDHEVRKAWLEEHIKKFEDM